MSLRNSMIVTTEEDLKKTVTIWSPTVITATIVMLVSGSLNSISFKYQGELGFKHGIFQTSFMFIGEWLNILLFGAKHCTYNLRKQQFSELKEKAEESGKKVKASKLLLMIPGLLDSIGSTLQIFPFLLIPASINQMLRGGVIIFTCIASRIFLGRKIYRHNILGVGLIIVGYVIVAISSFLGPSDDNHDVASTILGVGMVLLSLIIQASQFVVEEKICSKYQIPPVRMVGMEGQFGLVFLF